MMTYQIINATLKLTHARSNTFMNLHMEFIVGAHRTCISLSMVILTK